MMRHVVRRIDRWQAMLLLAVGALAMAGLPFRSLEAQTAPAAPGGLYVALHTWDTTGSTLSFRLVWTAVPGATSYDIRRGASGPVTAVSKGTQYTFTGPAGTVNTLYVRAKNGAGNSAWSSIGATTAQRGVPSGLSVYPGQDNLTLSWAQVTGASGYEVKLGPNGTVKSDLELETKWAGSAMEEHTFTGLTPNTEYTLYVRAKWYDGTSWSYSGWSSIAATTATPLLPPGEVEPHNLSVAAASTSLTLSWAVVPGEYRQYQVKRSGSSTVAAVLTGASHTFTGLTAGTEYTLYVRAAGGGYPFNKTTAWIPITATTTPTPPNSLSVMTASETTVTLGWGAVAGATSYEVKRSADGAATAASSNANHTFADLTPGTEYTLYLRGRNGDEPFAWRSITAKTEPLLEPTNLSVEAARTSLTLSWDGQGSRSWDGHGLSTNVYEVKLGTSGTATALADTNYASSTSYAFTGLTAGTEYTLYVRAKSGPNTEWKSITATTLPEQTNGPTATASVTTPPLQPRSLSATAASTELILSWAAMSGATSYEVKRGAGGTVTTGSSGASHPFSGLTANTEYTLYVRAKNSGGESGWSSITTKTAPAAPTGLSATAASDSISLSWTAVTGATSYEVKRSPGGETPTTVTRTSHRFPDLAAGTAYTLSVRAWNGSGASAWSPLAETTGPAAPAAPSENDLGTTATSTSITLSWPAVAGADSYDVKYSPGGETPTTVTRTSHTFPNLAAGTAYTLSVRARNSSGESGWSHISKTTVPAAPNPNAEATSTSITLSWPAVTGATGYDVKYSPGGERPTTVTDTSHRFPGLTANTAYTLSVRARNSSGASPWAPLSPTTAPAKPYVAPGPLPLRSGRGPTTAELNWTSSAGATHHEVKQGPDGAVETASGDDWHYFENLVPNVQYTLYVRAANSWGASEWARRTRLGTAPPPAPSDPTVQEESTTTTSLELSWTAARPSDTTTYEVKLNSGGAVTAADRINGHTFSGLTAGTAYTLYVRATDGGRPSAWSPPITATTALTAPPAP